MKAHPHRALTWHDITIQSQEHHHPDRPGAPVAIIRGELEYQEALISISHDGGFATAVCLAVGETLAGTGTTKQVSETNDLPVGEESSSS